MKKNIILGGIIGATLAFLHQMISVVGFVFSSNKNWDLFFSESILYNFEVVIIGFIVGCILGFFVYKLTPRKTGYSPRYWLRGGMMSVAFFIVVMIIVFITELWDMGWNISAFWNECGDMGCANQFLVFLFMIGIPFVFLIGSVIGAIYGRFNK